ncbi:endolytic transglycosylase MltG [Alicyclobacillus sp.]|uniref:endolytic transglycosylase MltG n=1 Tax=Alicyclobacillus sp. TaxID=61169 RepID=UPI0025BAE309|nr:endolytic transglycosylase MltG [Alicyclobacillus sp.]MCL6515966.1 endolytic transglycosylase MltG [Alicyclobacillus sp.]
MSGQTPMPARRGRLRRILAAAGVVILLGAGAAAVWLWQVSRPSPGTGWADVTVRPGESFADVAQALAAAGCVRNAEVFRLYAAWTGQAHRVQAGHYRIARGQAMSAVLDQLVGGRVVTDAVTVTIPEGFTVTQIADRLQASGVCSRQAFLDAVQHDTFSYDFVQAIPADKRIKWRLEGYLFPDTYRFTKGEAAHDVIDEMLRTFADRVTPEMRAEAKAQGKTLHEVLTEASMIEREAKVASERPLIASVIENRLHRKPPMKLQIDATVEYVLGHRDVVTDKDLEVDDPYNTYRYEGLPPGPIANPGLSSIEAALHPAHTDYLYYVVKNDGSGEHYFAATYAQQLHNEALSRANLKAHS